MEIIRSLVSDKLSLYRTAHEFRRYAEAKSVEEICALLQWAEKNGVRSYMIGNGSNVLFKQKVVESLIIKNCLPSNIDYLGDDRFRVSSSTSIAKLLKAMYTEKRDCCYYLASVPASVGGAVAMNAGRGRRYGMSIFDFLEEVAFIEGGERRILKKSEIEHGYRTTVFTGSSRRMITDVVFRFPKIELDGNPIRERIEYSKLQQDHGAANCGSVFKKCEGRIMWLLKMVPVRILGAQWSSKTENWMSNESSSPQGIRFQIAIAIFLHRLLGRKAVLELVEIE